MIAPRDSWMMPPPCNEMIPPGGAHQSTKDPGRGSFRYGGRDHLGIGGRHHSVTGGGIIQELGVASSGITIRVHPRWHARPKGWPCDVLNVKPRGIPSRVAGSPPRAQRRGLWLTNRGHRRAGPKTSERHTRYGYGAQERTGPSWHHYTDFAMEISFSSSTCVPRPCPSCKPYL